MLTTQAMQTPPDSPRTSASVADTASHAADFLIEEPDGTLSIRFPSDDELKDLYERYGGELGKPLDANVAMLAAMHVISNGGPSENEDGSLEFNNDLGRFRLQPRGANPALSALIAREFPGSSGDAQFNIFAADDSDTARADTKTFVRQNHDVILRGKRIVYQWKLAPDECDPENITVCAGCFATGAFAPKCSQCRSFYYCSKACQSRHWSAAHRAECRHVQRQTQEGLAARDRYRTQKRFVYRALLARTHCDLVFAPREEIGTDVSFWNVAEFDGALLCFAIDNATFLARCAELGISPTHQALLALEPSPRDGRTPPKAFVGREIGAFIVGAGVDAAAPPFVWGAAPKAVVRRTRGEFS